MSLIFVSGVVLSICIFRRTGIRLLGPILRSASSLAILMGTRPGNSTISRPSAQSFQTADFDKHLSHCIDSASHPPPPFSSSSSSLYVPPLLVDGLDPEGPHVHIPGGELADQYAPTPKAPPVTPPPEYPAPVPHVIQAPS